MFFFQQVLQNFYVNNVGQNIVDKFSKLSKIGLSVKCLRGDFLQFSSAIVKTFV